MAASTITDSSRLHIMLSGRDLQRQRAHSSHSERHDPHYRNLSSSASRSRETSRAAPASQTQTATAQSAQNSNRGELEPDCRGAAAASSIEHQTTPAGGASRFPSPPSSTTSETSSTEPCPQHGTGSSYMASSEGDLPASSSIRPSAGFPPSQANFSTATTLVSSTHQIPSPASDKGPRWNNSLSDLVGVQTNANRAPLSETPTTVIIRNLAHVESLARAGLGQSMNDPPSESIKYEISGMPINDVIEMVAALLTKITTTNDEQHDAMNRNAAHIRQAQAAASTSNDPNSEHMSPLSSSVLAFHGKNVPAITIASYLSRIHKYCPTTYEVFLSLLVYFDRMAVRVNKLVMDAEDLAREQGQHTGPNARDTSMTQAGVTPDPDIVMNDGGDESDEVDSDLADDDDDEDDDDDDGEEVSPSGQSPGTRTMEGGEGAAMSTTPTRVESVQAQPSAFSATSAFDLSTYFVVDSFNIHRLIIAGVTCASKFFSDVFYTNSRYAKVGGLPLPELNHLELQFLHLNDFRLAVPVEDLEAYATMLVEFYAREVLSQHSRPSATTKGS